MIKTEKKKINDNKKDLMLSARIPIEFEWIFDALDTESKEKYGKKNRSLIVLNILRDHFKKRKKSLLKNFKDGIKDGISYDLDGIVEDLQKSGITLEIATVDQLEKTVKERYPGIHTNDLIFCLDVLTGELDKEEMPFEK